ncbi:hypothetical protein Taro_015782, partial [Colocasia esculenta]|nr:hypothetical protein [Colocasia esculenta]
MCIVLLLYFEYLLTISYLFSLKLKRGHHDLVEVIVSIIRSIILRTDFSSGSNAADAHQLEVILPLLLSLLDERDSTAKAVVLLMAELCYINSDGRVLKEMCKCLSCGTRCQKKNAIDVILELVHGHPDSINEIFPSL